MVPLQSIAEEWVEKYNSNPFLKALAQIGSGCSYGILGAIETAIVTVHTNAQKRRVRLFFEHLEGQKLQLTQEMVQNEDFLYFFKATLNATIRTRRTEKIVYLATLFSAYTHEQDSYQLDKYEDYLKILDELSFIELRIVHLLYEKSRIKSEKENFNDEWWDNFDLKAVDVLKNDDILREVKDIAALMPRLTRSGLFQLPVGWTSSKRGYPTPLLEEFVSFITKDSEYIDVNSHL